MANSEESAPRQQKFVDSLLQNNASGMVLCSARQTPPLFFETLKRRKIPAIMVVRPVADAHFDFVGTDNFLGTQLATQHLLDLGHRHIAFIGGSVSSTSRAQRLGGLYQQAVGKGYSGQRGMDCLQ
ncbi:Ribose operon repressor [Serratia fonticola]|uniref:Ribose operon repressor n=1 Tax=Serratia fonticola TaxID=47917 RepID=A0A4U9W763_SERFO|nr:Ribose operon repressor [Serratia fonticola]